jgi:hypothetical protein
MSEKTDVVPTPPAPAPAAPAEPGVISEGVSKAQAAVSAAGENIRESISKGKESVAAFTGKYGIMVFVGIIVGVVIFFAAYVLYVYVSSRLTSKLLVVLPDTTMPKKGTELTKVDGGFLPPLTNGKRMTMLFWIYIHDINKFSGDGLRHVLHRGDESLPGASPEVYLDGTTNKLFVRFSLKTETTPTHLAAAATPPNGTMTVDTIRTNLATHGIVVEYIPLQRWVHVAIVVNETINQGSVTAYLDGEVVSSLSSGDMVTLSNETTKVAVSYQNLNLEKKGDIYIGGDIYNENVSRGFSGLVSKVAFTNYDMNGQEIKKEYVKGPMDNLTSKLGLPAYGLRSPVYRVG